MRILSVRAAFGPLSSCFHFVRAGLFAGAFAFAVAAESDGGYLFVTFKGGDSPRAEQVHFALSEDGRSWTALNGGDPVLTSWVGEQGARDPYLLRAHDGRGFFLMATDLSMHHTQDWKRAVRSGSRAIVIWESPDLVSWSEPRLVEVAPKDAGCAWAPEAIYDEEKSDYLVFWASTTAGDDFARHRIWAARTQDFRKFSEPFLYIERPTSTIDTTIVRDGKNYYRFTKDEKHKAVTMEKADRLAGPWTEMPDFSLANLVGYEGPQAYRLRSAGEDQPATWALILDHYAEKRGYQPFVTREIATGRFEQAGDFAFPFRFRHGSVLPITAAEVARLRVSYAREAEADLAGKKPPRPILDGYTADPAIRVFGDTYYVYPTSDKPEWMTTDFSVWSSKNLVEWKKERMILNVAHDLQWANIRAWAPDCIERDGRYCFYFSADKKIGVAQSDSPAGPFVDALGAPLLDRKADPRITSNTIDPYPFIDDDGQAYLYWGNSSGKVNVVKLKRDMVTVDGPPVEFVIKGASFGRTIEFREGIVVFKRAGKYYFMWSVDDTRSIDYRVAYGTSDGPFGPVSVPENATVLQRRGPVQGTGHHSVVNVPGTDRWYAAYHRHAIPGGNGYTRETCLARMEFEADGRIKPMDPMRAAFLPGDEGEPVVDGRSAKAARGK